MLGARLGRMPQKDRGHRIEDGTEKTSVKEKYETPTYRIKRALLFCHDDC